LMRGKARDLYDVWLVLGQGIEPDRALIEQKLAYYGIEWSPQLLTEALARIGVEWERDLRHLLPQMVPFDLACDGIIASLT